MKLPHEMHSNMKTQPEYWSHDQKSTKSVRPDMKEEPEVRLSNAVRDVDAADFLCYRQQYLETKSQVQAYISPRSHLTAVITAAKGILLEVSRNCSFPSIITFSRQRETALKP